MTDDVRSFLTVAMIVVGALILALCGPCTAFFAIGALTDIAKGHSGGEFPPDFVLTVAAVLGVPPMLVGGLLVWGGFQLRRRSPTHRSTPPPSAPPPG